MVHLTVKTIKGKKFQIEVEPTQTVKEVKNVIEETNPEFPAAQLKLIHSGKILKDESSLEEYKIKEDEFLVCMVTKPKPAAAAPAPAAPAPAPASSAGAATASSPAAAPATHPTAAAASAAAAAPANEDHIRQLTDMGFPEDHARAALLAAMGNPDVAVDLMTGSDNFQAAAAPPPAAAASSPAAMETLEDFRGHPQFNDLKRLVQRDPAMLSDVLQMIGQQSPTLLARIHENQGEFIALMNEPVDESAPPAAPASPAGGMGALGSMMGSGAGMNNPAQMAQMLQSLSPAARAQMAAAMGVSPQQLAQVSQVIGSLPPDQLQQLMGMVNSGGGPGAGMGGMRGMPPGAGGAGRNVIHLTEEEGAAVARLAELGFDRTDAAQAYLACDKNEALAANLLMDGMGGGVQPAFQSPAPSSTPVPAPAAPEAPTPSASAATIGNETPSASADAATPGATAAPTPISTEQATTSDQPADAEGGRPESGPDEDEDMYG